MDRDVFGFLVLLAAVFAFGLLIGSAVLSADAWQWATGWQTLIAGFLAIFAAAATIWWMRAQMAQTAAIAQEAQRREFAGVRAVMPLALSNICDYAEKCASALDPLTDASSLTILVAGGLKTIPDIPGGAILIFRDWVRLAAPDVGHEVGELISRLQVQHARITDLRKGSERYVSRGTAAEFVVDAAEVYARASKLFPVARGLAVAPRTGSSSRRRAPPPEEAGSSSLADASSSAQAAATAGAGAGPEAGASGTNSEAGAALGTTSSDQVVIGGGRPDKLWPDPRAAFTLEEAAANGDGTYDLARALSWLSACVGAGLSEAEVRAEIDKVAAANLAATAERDQSRPKLRITSKVEGFRRAGVSHPKAATDHPVDRFSRDEVLALVGDPNLTVYAVDPDGDVERIVIHEGELMPESAVPKEQPPAPTP